jgi:hypothetical protein
MEVKQMMARMLAEMKAEIRTNQAKADTNVKEIRAGKELLKEMLAKMDAKIDANLKIITEMKSWQEETKAILEKWKANPEETDQNKTRSKAEHEELPKEEATVKPVRAIKKWYGDQNLAIRHCQKLKKRTHSNDGSQKKLAAAC